MRERITITAADIGTIVVGQPKEEEGMGKATRVSVVAAHEAVELARSGPGTVLEVRRDYHSTQLPGELIAAIQLTPEQAAAIESFDNFFVRFAPVPAEEAVIELDPPQ